MLNQWIHFNYYLISEAFYTIGKSFYIVILSSFFLWLQGIKVLLQFFWSFFLQCFTESSFSDYPLTGESCYQLYLFKFSMTTLHIHSQLLFFSFLPYILLIINPKLQFMLLLSVTDIYFYVSHILMGPAERFFRHSHLTLCKNKPEKAIKFQYFILSLLGKKKELSHIFKSK